MGMIGNDDEILSNLFNYIIGVPSDLTTIGKHRCCWSVPFLSFQLVHALFYFMYTCYNRSIYVNVKIRSQGIILLVYCFFV